MSRLEYPVLVAPLPIEDGGGFIATVPDLPGCMSDGATPEEAVSNVQDAIVAWIEAARDNGPPIHMTWRARNRQVGPGVIDALVAKIERGDYGTELADARFEGFGR